MNNKIIYGNQWLNGMRNKYKYGIVVQIKNYKLITYNKFSKMLCQKYNLNLKNYKCN